MCDPLFIDIVTQTIVRAVCQRRGCQSPANLRESFALNEAREIPVLRQLEDFLPFLTVHKKSRYWLLINPWRKERRKHKLQLPDTGAGLLLHPREDIDAGMVQRTDCLVDIYLPVVDL